MSKTIAIDLDSVIADVTITWISEYNRLKNTNFTKEDITVWEIHTILSITEKESDKLFLDVWKHKWRDIPPTQINIGKVIGKLKTKGYRISIITKRERKTIPYVHNWLDKNKIYCDDLVFIFDNDSKNKYPFNVLVDDNPKNLMDIKFPKSGILFDQPWNMNFDWPVRIKSLAELISIIDTVIDPNFNKKKT